MPVSTRHFGHATDRDLGLRFRSSREHQSRSCVKILVEHVVESIDGRVRRIPAVYHEGLRLKRSDPVGAARIRVSVVICHRNLDLS